MNTITIDIETLPSQRPDVLEEIRASKQAELDYNLASIAPPGNYKKQETIDVWMADEAPKVAKALTAAFDADVDAAYRKTGLDGSFGQICVIGWACNDADSQAVFSQDDERHVLKSFQALLASQIRRTDELLTCVVGHNVSAFDLRFITQRSIINGFKPHPVIARAAMAKPWETDKVFDTMVQWAGVGNRVKLDKLCKALSIATPKGDIDGSKVWDFVQAGKIAEVAEYCKRDVKATREVYYRMNYLEVQQMALAA